MNNSPFKSISVSLKSPKLFKALALVGVLVVSLVMRLLSIWHSLPLYPHTDEKDFVVSALLMVQKMGFDPGWYGVPGTPFMYLLYPFYFILFCIKLPLVETLKTGSLTQYRYFLEHTWATYVPNMWDTFYIGRVVNTVVSIGTIYLLFVLAQKIFKNYHVALLSMIMLSIASVFRTYGGLARTDILTVFFVLLSMIVFYDAMTTKSVRKFILAAFIAGVSFGTRYHALITAFPLGIYATIEDFKSYKLKGFWTFVRDSIFLRTYTSLAMISVFLGFFLSTPFTVLNWKIALWNIRFEARGVSPGTVQPNALDNFLWYIPNVYIDGVGGIALFVLALVGIYALYKFFVKDKKLSIPTLLMFIFPVLFYIILSFAKLRWDRWMLPVVPYECMLASYGLYFVCDFAIKKFFPTRAKFTTLVFWIIGVIVVAVPFKNYYATIVDRAEMSDDLVITWINDNVSMQEKSKIAIEGTSNSNLEKYAARNGLLFTDVTQNRVFLNESAKNNAMFLVIVKDASKTLYCYEKVIFDTGLICDKDKLHDSQMAKNLTGFTKVATIDRWPYAGPNYQIYRKVQ